MSHRASTCIKAPVLGARLPVQARLTYNRCLNVFLYDPVYIIPAVELQLEVASVERLHKISSLALLYSTLREVFHSVANAEAPLRCACCKLSNTVSRTPRESS